MPRALRLLVAEDDEDTREVLAQALGRALGAQVDTAADGEDARERLLREEPYDLLVTDERMPGLPGSELIRWARRQDRVARCVLMSAYHDGPTLADAAGADLFLRKPFELGEAVPKLRALL